MNDLEPWKIWAVTGVLVCAIFATSAARVRSQTTGDATSLADDATPGESSQSATMAYPTATAYQFEAYPSYIPHRSFNTAGYSDVQSSSFTPTNNLLYGSGTPAATETEAYPEPVLDVARQILANEASTADLLAANNDQTTQNQVQIDMFTDVPDDHWAYAAVLDEPDYDQTVNSIDREDLVFSDPSDPPAAKAFDLALQNVIVNVAMNTPNANSAVNVLQMLGSGNENAAALRDEVDSLAVAPDVNLAMSGELDKELGDEGDFADEQQNEALRAEAKALVLAQAQANFQSAMQQQQVEAIYTLNVANATLQMNGVQFSVPPQE